jgi:putative two-component system response regulator
VSAGAAARRAVAPRRSAAPPAAAARPAASFAQSPGGAMKRQARVLVVDDTEQSMRVIANLVRSLGCTVETAADGLEAFGKLAGVDLILLDVMMPGLDGYAVARCLRQDPRWSDLPIIMVTALDTREDRLQAVAAGASDFISKPVDLTELRLRIDSQLRLKEAHDTVKRSRLDLEDMVTQRTAELRQALSDMAEERRHTYSAHVDSIQRLVLAAELKDMGTAHHIKRLSHYSRILADALGMTAGEAEVLGHAVTMHDVGKLGVPDAILAKPGKLTGEERRVMQAHTWIGARLLEDSPSELIEAGRVVALTHHERWDGSGYPQGLAGESIPLWGRICAVIDVFDALTTHRPYREPMPALAALEALAGDRGRHFDPVLVDHFLDRCDVVLALHEELNRAEDSARDLSARK